MSGQIGALVKAGVAFKVAQFKQATSAYVEDRTDHGKSIIAGYAVAAGMYAAAGIFLIAACLVGVAALFRWLELQYGFFTALGVCGGVLLALTLLCAVIASSRLNAKPPTYPSLSTRLGAALKGNPLKPAGVAAKDSLKASTARVAQATRTATQNIPSRAATAVAEVAPTPRPDAIRSARKTAETVLRKPASPKWYDRPRPASVTKAGVVLGASLLGWALVRRRRQEFAQVAPKT